MSQIQRDFNNSINIDNFLNEIVYDFISIQIIVLTKFINVDIFEFTLKKRRFIIRQNVNDVIFLIKWMLNFIMTKNINLCSWNKKMSRSSNYTKIIIYFQLSTKNMINNSLNFSLSSKKLIVWFNDWIFLTIDLFIRFST